MSEQCANLIDEVTKIRKSKGWTQQDLAKASGLTQSVIARIESKKSIPTLATFQKLILAMDKTLYIG